MGSLQTAKTVTIMCKSRSENGVSTMVRPTTKLDTEVVFNGYQFSSSMIDVSVSEGIKEHKQGQHCYMDPKHSKMVWAVIAYTPRASLIR
ncbi:hypothetical protein TNCV_1188361 [Trichonephila clavipes]|nr:hypothetical protein TNCV_1188361 [Trichonephila clavipes]